MTREMAQGDDPVKRPGDCHLDDGDGAEVEPSFFYHFSERTASERFPRLAASSPTLVPYSRCWRYRSGLEKKQDCTHPRAVSRTLAEYKKYVHTRLHILTAIWPISSSSSWPRLARPDDDSPTTSSCWLPTKPLRVRCTPKRTTNKQTNKQRAINVNKKSVPVFRIGHHHLRVGSANG